MITKTTTIAKKGNAASRSGSRPRSGSKAFTLVEMMVAVALFAIVMVIATSAILSIIDGNKKSQAIDSVINNLDFSVDSMVRDIKTGYDYQCDDGQGNSAPCDPTSPVSYITLNSTLASPDRDYGNASQVTYRLDTDTGTIMKTYCDTDISVTDPSACVVTIPLTAPEIDITKLQFYVNGPQPGMGQPSVFLVIQGEANIANNQVTQFNLQTFISQRLLNL